MRAMRDGSGGVTGQGMAGDRLKAALASLGVPLEVVDIARPPYIRVHTCPAGADALSAWAEARTGIFLDEEPPDAEELQESECGYWRANYAARRLEHALAGLGIRVPVAGNHDNRRPPVVVLLFEELAAEKLAGLVEEAAG